MYILGKYPLQSSWKCLLKCQLMMPFIKWTFVIFYVRWVAFYLYFRFSLCSQLINSGTWVGNIFHPYTLYVYLFAYGIYPSAYWYIPVPHYYLHDVLFKPNQPNLRYYRNSIHMILAIARSLVTVARRSNCLTLCWQIWQYSGELYYWIFNITEIFIICF